MGAAHTRAALRVAAAEWLAQQDVMLLGSDNFPVEIAPNPDKNLSLPVHQIALAVNGIFLLEDLKLDELVAKRAYEFASSCSRSRSRAAPDRRWRL